jgi:hypothetical protein
MQVNTHKGKACSGMVFKGNACKGNTHLGKI